MKAKKITGGSIKIDPEVQRSAASYCKKKGILISNFATDAVREKLKRERSSPRQDVMMTTES